MIKEGELSSFMAGWDYILIENKLADYLASLDIPQIEFKDAIIWNRGLNKEYFNYKQLIVRKYMTEENFETLDLRGLQMYLFSGNSLFVSPQLKELLEKSEFNFLLFSEGFNRLAKDKR
jgi:hypothetical protein